MSDPEPFCREAFVTHLNANPPTKHRHYARFLAGSTYGYNPKGTHPNFGHWLRDYDRPDFDRLYVAWCKSNGVEPRAVRPQHRRRGHTAFLR